MNKKKFILPIILLLILIGLVVGISFALYKYDFIGQSGDLVLGDIYMHYDETNSFSLQAITPGGEYSQTEYFEFTVSGKNTYSDKDIWYDINLTRGDVPEGKNEQYRIPDQYLKFKLVEVVSNQEVPVFTDRFYSDLTNQRVHVETINKNTLTEVNKTYRLYMKVDNSLVIGNSDRAVFSFEEWSQAFASIKVKVTGNFEEKEVSLTSSITMKEKIEEITTDTCNPIIVEDGITYFSGTNDCVNFNYVWYSGKLWRVTAIYPDGTMKMITEDLITSLAYGKEPYFYINEEDNSYIYQWLNEDFLDTLDNYENIIVTDSKWNVTEGDGTVSYKLPETDLVESTVGMLNSYEYYKSYENLGDDGFGTGYLNIEYKWSLLNPYLPIPVEEDNTSSGNSGVISSLGYMSIVTDSGIYGRGHHDSTGGGIRPSIILKETVKFLKDGNGTKENPYKIIENSVTPNTTLLNTRTSGEYISVNEELFRIVGTEIINEKLSTKLTKVDYIRDTSDNVITKALASTSTFGATSNTQSDDYWDYYLNNTWIKEFDSTYDEETGVSGILEKGVYYLGETDIGNSYKLSICATVSTDSKTKSCEKTTDMWSGYVGLLRYGEMFSTQLGAGTSSSNNIWLITPRNYFVTWMVYNDALAFTSRSAQVFYGVRPTIHLKSTIVIKSGSGTAKDPFVVGLPS